MTADAEVGVPASLDQFVGDLASRRTGADHEHGAFGQPVRVAVVAGVDLQHFGRQTALQRRHAPALIQACCRRRRCAPEVRPAA